MDKIALTIINRFYKIDSVNIDKVELIGSRNKPNLIDKWSDVDLKIWLNEKEIISNHLIDTIIHSIGELVTKEIILNQFKVLCRTVCVINGQIELVNGINKNSLDYLVKFIIK